MSKARLLCAGCLCAFYLAAAAAQAGDTIDADKMSGQQLMAAIRAASDDTVIESGGVKKTKAQWRSDAAAQKKPDASVYKALAERLNAKFEQTAKALQDEQDRKNAEENAKITKKFEDLTGGK